MHSRRSVATGRIGNFRTMPVKTLRASPSLKYRHGLSCRVLGGHAHGSVAP